MSITPKEACDLVNSLLIKPGWKVTAQPWQQRHESSIRLHVEFEAQDTSYPPDYPHHMTVVGDYALMTGDCRDGYDVLRKVLGIILSIEEHEWREWLKLGEEHDYRPPFHPHTDEGMIRWAHLGHRFTGQSELEHALTHDLQFGRL